VGSRGTDGPFPMKRKRFRQRGLIPLQEYTQKTFELSFFSRSSTTGLRDGFGPSCGHVAEDPGPRYATSTITVRR
jgi:hypothetical protein